MTVSAYPTASSASNPLQDENPPIVELKDNFSAPEDIRSSHASLYTRINISLTFVWITDVQDPLWDIDPAHSRELGDSICNQRFDHNQVLTYVSAYCCRRTYRPPRPFGQGQPKDSPERRLPGRSRGRVQLPQCVEIILRVHQNSNQFGLRAAMHEIHP